MEGAVVKDTLAWALRDAMDTDGTAAKPLSAPDDLSYVDALGPRAVVLKAYRLALLQLLQAGHNYVKH